MGALKFLVTIAFKFKSIFYGIILFFREIKVLFSGGLVESTTTLPKSIIPAINSIRIWFLYVKENLSTFITIIIVIFVIIILWNYFFKKDENIENWNYFSNSFLIGLKYNNASMAPEFAQPKPSRMYSIEVEAISPANRDTIITPINKTR